MLKIEISYDPAIPTLDIYQINENTNLKRYVHSMFTVALFTKAKIQKQSKYP